MIIKLESSKTYIRESFKKTEFYCKDILFTTCGHFYVATFPSRAERIFYKTFISSFMTYLKRINFSTVLILVLCSGTKIGTVFKINLV